MFKRISITSLLLFCISAATVSAHTPLCSCFDNGDETVTCVGGFSDGSSASGVEMRVLDKRGKVLIKGKMNEDSDYTFDKPAGDYSVLFDAGDGHEIQVDSKEIIE